MFQKIFSKTNLFPSFVFFGVVVFDQVSKSLASIFFTIRVNTGIAFGIFSGTDSISVFILSTASLSLAIAIFYFANKTDARFSQIASVALLAAVFSNTIDRILFGGVRDYLPIPLTNVHNNLADYVVVLALCSLLAVQLRHAD